MKYYFLAIVFTFYAAAAIAQSVGYQIGQIADDFKLKNVDGKWVSMADYPDAKGFVIIFTCNHCPYAKMYEDRIIALHQKYSAHGYYVIAINPNDPAVVPEDGYAEMIQLAKDKKFSFPYLVDEGQKVYPAFGASRTPHVFMLDKHRTVRYIGAIDDNPRDQAAVKVNYAENAIQAIMAGKNPEPSITKAIGCSIKKKT